MIVVFLFYSLFSFSNENIQQYLGFAESPLTIEKQIHNNKIVEYKFGSFGNRISPDTVNATKHLVLMGGSNTFGEMLSDKETLAAIFHNNLERHQICTLASRGWGPSHILALFDFFPIQTCIPPTPGLALFFLYDYHINRVVGNSHFLSWSAGEAPKYVIDEHNKLIYKGPFSKEKWKTLFLSFLGKILTPLHRTFPPVTQKDAIQTIRVIKQIAKKYSTCNRFFYVVIPPISWRTHPKHYQWFISELKKERISILKPTLLDNSFSDFHFEDGHLNKNGTKKFATILLQQYSQLFKN